MKLSEAIREWKSNITTHMAVEYVLTLRADINSFSDAAQALETENAKLRELVHKQDTLTKAVYAYWAGGERTLDDFNMMMGANAQVLTLMRELGIEVSER